ncbi:MAG: YbaB/EbfC family nucleoid-associated protein [Planctomycetota bacterium]|jgi:DNA-binding YbaB/EbfC family protein
MAKGGFGDLGQLMKQAQQMMKQREKIVEELKERVVDASAGGGMVKAYVNGAQELMKISLEPEVVDPDEREMLEDLVVAAVNEAIRESKKLSEKEMAKLAGGLPGGMPGGLSGLLGG